MALKRSTGSNPFYDNGAIGDGSTDDWQALQDILTRGETIALSPDKQYRINRPLQITVAGTGVIAPYGSTLIMSQAAGAFDNDVYADRTSITTAGGKKYAVGIYASNVDDVVIAGGTEFLRIIPSTYTDVRYLTQIFLTGCEDPRIDKVEITNFSRGAGNIKVVDCARPLITNNWIHDIYTVTTTGATGATIQVTGIEIDDNSTTGSYDGIVAGNRIENLTNSSGILAAVGNVQSDAINIKGTDNKSRGFLIEGNIIKNVAEGVDHFGYNSVIQNNRFERCFGAGVKIFHGASYNLIQGNHIQETGLAALYTGGTNSSTLNCEFNTFRNNKIVWVNRAINWVGADGNNFYTTSAGSTFWTNTYAFSSTASAGTITAGIRVDVLSGGTSQCNNALFESNEMDLGYTGSGPGAAAADRGFFHEGTSLVSAVTNIVRPHIIRNVKSGGRKYQDSGNYVVYEGFPWQKISQTADKTFTNNTSAQTIFDGDGAGTYSGTYTSETIDALEFHLEIVISGLSASAHTLSFSFGGTATYSWIALQARAGTGTTSSVVADYNVPITGATATVVTPSNSDAVTRLIVSGQVYVSAGGTIIPQITQNSNSTAAVLETGSFAQFRKTTRRAVTGEWS